MEHLLSIREFRRRILLCIRIKDNCVIEDILYSVFQLKTTVSIMIAWPDRSSVMSVL